LSNSVSFKLKGGRKGINRKGGVKRGKRRESGSMRVCINDPSSTARVGGKKGGSTMGLVMRSWPADHFRLEKSRVL